MKMEVIPNSILDTVYELTRTILRGICGPYYSGRKIYVWSKARVEGNKVVSIKNVINEFKDKGAIPIERLEDAFKFPFILFSNINFICESSVEVLMVMYFINDYEPIGFRLSLSKSNNGWKTGNMDIVLIA